MTKVCSECGTEKPLDDYHRRTRSRDGFSAACKPCRSDQRRRSLERRGVPYGHSPESTRRSNERWRYRQYGITQERYQELLAAQGGRCAICRTSDPGTHKGSWCVDHDHSCCRTLPACGRCVRGLLCRLCNIKVGYAEAGDRHLVLAYIERFKP